MSAAPLGADALAEARAAIAVGSKSFALASRLFAAPTRDCAHVIYAWCRRADDAVDRAPRGAQRGAVAQLRAELERIYAPAGARDPALPPALAAFGDVVRACAIPREYPAELLAGMEMDALGARYASAPELYRYCYRVAGTVGLMMSHVMGVRERAVLRNAAHMGIAMQLTNICRDVLEDWQLGRLYVPHALLEECGAGKLEAELGGPLPQWARAPLARAVRQLLADAQRFYASGDRGLPALPWQCALAVRSARMIYAQIGAQLERADCDVTAGRAVVPGWRKLALSARAAACVAGELPARARAARGRAAAAPAALLPALEFPAEVLPI